MTEELYSPPSPLLVNPIERPLPESNGSPPSPLLSPIARLVPESVGTGDSGGLAVFPSTSTQGVFNRDCSTARGPRSTSSPIIDHDSEDDCKIIAITHPGNSQSYSTSHGREEPASEAFNGVHEARKGPCHVGGSCVRCSCGQKCQYLWAFWQHVFFINNQIINDLPSAGMCMQHRPLPGKIIAKVASNHPEYRD